MVQIIDRRPSFGEQFGRALGTGAGEGLKQGIDTRNKAKQLAGENEQIKKQLGIDLSGINDPEQRREFVKNKLLGRQEQEKNTLLREKEDRDLVEKYNFEELQHGHSKELQKEKYGFENEKLTKEKKEKIAPFVSGLKNLNKMRELFKKGNLGLLATAKTPFSSAARKDRAEYEQLGKSLISLASTIPIRNQLEFETLSHDLYDPSNTQAKIEGTLNAMESIIKNSMQENEEDNIEKESSSMQPSGEIVEMKDKDGNVYDIPMELQEQARAQGLM